MSDWKTIAKRRLEAAMSKDKNHPPYPQLNPIPTPSPLSGFQPYRIDQIQTTLEYQYLNQKQLVKIEKKTNKRQKLAHRSHQVQEGVVHLERVRYHQFSVAAFPFSYWTAVFEARARDILKAVYITPKDIVHSHEGFKFYVKTKLVYLPSTNKIRWDVVRYGRIVQSVIGSYFVDHRDDLVEMWVVTRQARLEPDGRVSIGIKFHFRNLVVNLGMARQLLESIRMRFQEEPGNTLMIKNHFDKELIQTRPIYSSRIIHCPKCPTPTDTPTICSTCLNYTYLISQYIYTPHIFLDRTDKVLPFKFNPEQLNDVIRQCSPVPPTDLAEYTGGYGVPTSAPGYIPVQDRSKNAKDRHSTHIYKKDRLSINKLNQKGVVVEDLRRLDLIVKEIRGYHPAYRSAKLSSVIQNRTCFFADLISGGRSFCRITTPEGKTHNSNRVYFRLTANTITQYCYDCECRAKMKSQPGLKETLTQSLINGTRLFYESNH